MDDQKEKNSWMSVPQFGAWDGTGSLPDYSMDFSKIRESRKQNKKDISRASVGNEEELANPDRHDGKNDQKYHDHQQQQQQQSELSMHAPNDSPKEEKDTELLHLLRKRVIPIGLEIVLYQCSW